MVRNVDQLLALLYFFKIFIYIEYFKPFTLFKICYNSYMFRSLFDHPQGALKFL